ncbi:MAG: cupin domain-containing protein [Planctomycetaceae bacterium]|nr:cupin domain-containing protein [Planctomycetaceae bacterium]
MAKETVNGTFDLVKELAYQPGGIVSRIVLRQPTGSVTAFAFDEGQELSEHTCPYDALLHVIDGSAEVTLGGTVHRVDSPQMLRLPAHVPHAVRAPRQFKMLLTMLRGVEGQP